MYTIRKNRLANILAAVFMLLLVSSCLKQKEDNPPGGGTNPPIARKFDWPKIADSAQSALNSFYWNASGKFYTAQANSTAFNSNYWPNAHGLEVLLDVYKRKNNDAGIKMQMDELLNGLKAANGNSYINYYYDDMEWMMIATLRAYKETNDIQYKNASDVLWTDVKGGWDNASGGGFYWRKDKVNKNTPANAPACIFAARLYQQNNNMADLNWAKDTYGWLKTHMMQANGEVWDGLSTNVSPITYDSRSFTYNYGIVIGSALELFKTTGQQSYKDDAIRVAGAAISTLARDGILPAGDNGDGGLFNGIFIRYLARLIIDGDIPSATKTNFIAFIQKNAETMWQKGTLLPAGLIGPDWKKIPSASTTLNPHLSGVMLIEAMAEFKKLNLID